MVGRKYLNPLFISVFLCVIIVYSRPQRVPVKNPLVSLISQNKISSVYGILSSSPSKTQKGNYYSCSLLVSKVIDSQKMESSAYGKIGIMIPSSYVEAFFPGKLYSLSEADSIFETGSHVMLSGSFSNNTFFAKGALSFGFGNGRTQKIKKIRALGRLKFKRLMYKWGDAGGFLLALLSGSKEYTDPQVSEQFRKSGLSHILALSGMHLSLFSSLAFFIGSMAGRKKISLILQLTAVILFVWFAGFSPSLLRAFICVSILLFQMIINIEKTEMFLVICFSFFVQSLISPNDLLNSGFILSYGALCGILIFGEFFRKIYSFIFPKIIANSLSASTSAQLLTLPISYKLFGQITPVGVISSVVVSPFVSLFIYSGLAFIVLGLIIPPLSTPGGIFMQIQYNFIKYLVGLFSKVPPLVI